MMDMGCDITKYDLMARDLVLVHEDIEEIPKSIARKYEVSRKFVEEVFYNLLIEPGMTTSDAIKHTLIVVEYTRSTRHTLLRALKKLLLFF